MAMFFTSDLHFGHVNIIGFCDRPWADVPAMNAGLISRWNEKVTNSDYVFVLGDFAMGKISETLPIAERLNGHKFLVPGNHDRCFSKSKDSEKWIKAYREVGFDVLPERYLVGLGDTHAMVCHFPYSVNAHDERFADKHPEDLGGLLLSGHVHDAWLMQERNINVGTDVWDYAPAHEDEIMNLFTTGEK